MTAAQVVRRLTRDGWYEVRKSGSHRQFRHADKPGVVTVPMHRGDVPRGTLAGIYRQAGWDREP